MPTPDHLLIRRLGRREYAAIFEAMRSFSARRGPEQVDEIWLLEHDPVFTQGLNGQAEHVLAAGEIPLVQTDRGGQVTYHGPGQLVVYVLIDVRRRRLGVRHLVSALEESVVELVRPLGVAARARPDAPGVYVGERKLASLGLRIRRGCSYHGLSLNVAMDLAPFQRINPCGFAGLRMTQLRDLGSPLSVNDAADALVPILTAKLGYTVVSEQRGLPQAQTVATSTA